MSFSICLHLCNPHPYWEIQHFYHPRNHYSDFYRYSIFACFVVSELLTWAIVKNKPTKCTWFFLPLILGYIVKILCSKSLKLFLASFPSMWLFVIENAVRLVFVYILFSLSASPALLVVLFLFTMWNFKWFKRSKFCQKLYSEKFYSLFPPLLPVLSTLFSCAL